MKWSPDKVVPKRNLMESLCTLPLLDSCVEIWKNNSEEDALFLLSEVGLALISKGKDYEANVLEGIMDMLFPSVNNLSASQFIVKQKEREEKLLAQIRGMMGK